MTENIEEYFILLVSLFAIVNSFTVMPVFISLTRTQTRGDRRRISLQTALAALSRLPSPISSGERGPAAIFSASILSRIAGRRGETGMSIMERLMGLILAVIAVELVTTAIGEMYPGLLN